jgi:putative Holliday junction resolvase
MRFVGVDFGRRRIGLALSDATGTLARPWQAVAVSDAIQSSAGAVAALIVTLRAEAPDGSDDIGAIVVGMPRRLGGGPTTESAAVHEFALALGNATGLSVHLQDERLTSHAADELLAERERDWRRRKAKLDAVAAAIILQDFLDERARLKLAEGFRVPGQ